MNIVFLFHSPILPQNGGVQRVTSLIADELIVRGHNVYYLMTHKVQTVTQNNWSYRQHAIDCSKKTDKVAQCYKAFLNDNKIDAVISQIADEESLFLLANTPTTIKRLSVCHIQPFPLLGMERDFKKGTKPHDIKHISSKFITILCPYLYRRRILTFGKKQFQRMATVSDKIVLLSNKFFPRILSYTDVPITKLVAINNPNSFETNTLDENIKKENLLIYVGRLENVIKNIFNFVDMWRIFSKKHPDWKAEIIGEGEAHRDIERYIKKHHVDRISLKGNQNDVESYYRRAKFVCLTSRSEGWGMVLTEGMTYGCVPVCYDSYESCHDIISDEEDGIIIAPFNTLEMASRIAEVGDNKSKYEIFSERAIRKVKQFNTKTIVNQWESLLFEI